MDRVQTWICFFLFNVVFVSSLTVNNPFQIPESNPVLASGDRFGTALTEIGDLDNNGVVDLAISAPSMTGMSRTIYLLSMNANGTVINSTQINSGNTNFGRSLAYLERTNELIVGSPDVDQILLFSLDSPQTSNPTTRNFNGDSSSGFGTSMTVHDFNGDGFEDLMVGAPQAEENGNLIGTLFYLPGVMSGITLVSENIIQIEFSNGPPDGQAFGFAVAHFPDIGNDNFDDVITTAAVGDQTSLWFVQLDANGFRAQTQLIESPTQETVDSFGLGIFFLGDIDADGYHNIAVGSPSDPASPDGTVNILNVLTAPISLQTTTIIIPSISFPITPGTINMWGFGLTVWRPDSRLQIVAGATGTNNMTGSVIGVTIPSCGDGVVDTGENCDDNNFISDDGCNLCTVETGYQCSPGSPSVCVPICGDSLIFGNEECDDGNTNDSDGCSSECLIETGFSCTSACNTICGDSMVTGNETCDDGNIFTGDGCDDLCRTEDGSISNVTTAIVATVIPVIFCLLCVCILSAIAAFLFLKKKNKKSQSYSFLLSNSDIAILDDVTIGKFIGSGEFGAVYYGSWKGKEVALKSLKSDNLQEIANEFTLLSQLRHPNILFLHGLFNHDNLTYMVTEFMNKGNLLHFLQSEAELTLFDLIFFTKEIAAGMEYLHNKNVLHRDLAARNILISSSNSENSTMEIKISDFGLSRHSESYYQSESKKIPVRWTAPEVIEFGKATQFSDVWSFGIVLFEIFSRGAIPYAGMTNAKVIKSVNNGHRLKVPTETPQSIGKLMHQCWNTTPEERPQFSVIHTELKNVKPEKSKSKKLQNQNQNDSKSQSLKEMSVSQLEFEAKQVEREIQRLKAEIYSQVSCQQTSNVYNTNFYNNE